MANARYVESGHRVRIVVPDGGEAVSNGDFVRVGDLLAVALENVAAGESGDGEIEGVWGNCPLTAPGGAHPQGTRVNWDQSEQEFTVAAVNTASDIKDAGWLWRAVGAADTKAYIKLTPPGEKGA